MTRCNKATDKSRLSPSSIHHIGILASIIIKFVKLLTTLPTDHLSNIFQTKFLPNSNDRVIVSAARGVVKYFIWT